MPDDYLKRNLHFVTADKIGDTGTVSFTYMGEVDRAIRDAFVRLPWGYIWQPNQEVAGAAFNFWKSGALVVGGGFSEQDTPAQRAMMLDALPEDASVLCTTKVFEWMRDHVLNPASYPFERHHVDHPLMTN